MYVRVLVTRSKEGGHYAFESCVRAHVCCCYSFVFKHTATHKHFYCYLLNYILLMVVVIAVVVFVLL